MIQLVLGRSKDCDVRLPDESVSGRHARLMLAEDGKITLEDLQSSNGTFVNGRRIQMAMLSSDDVVRLGQCLLPWKLILERAKGTVICSQIKKSISLGRDTANDFPIEHESVSRQHALLHLCSDGSAVVEDLNSSNGTFINGQRVKKCRLLKGESLSIGHSQLNWEAVVASFQRAQTPPAPKASATAPASSYVSFSAKPARKSPVLVLLSVVFAVMAVAIIYLIFFDATVLPYLKEQFGPKTPVATHQIPLKPAGSIPSDANFSDLVEYVEHCVFLIETSDKFGYNLSMGTGFFVNASGIGVTNHHVIEGFSKFRIKTINGEVFEIGKIIKSSKKHDFAVFEVRKPSGRTFPSLPLAKELPRKGDAIFVVGNPQGIESTLSKGVVSAVRGEYNSATGKFTQGDVFIQIDAAISPGSSGSPVMNMKGEVVGIATMILSGKNTQNLNFAVNIKLLGLD